MSDSATDKDQPKNEPKQEPKKKPDAAAERGKSTGKAVTAQESSKAGKHAASQNKVHAAAGSQRSAGTWIGVLAILVALAAAAGSYYLWKQQGLAEQSVAQRESQFTQQQRQLQSTVDQDRATLDQLANALSQRVDRLDQNQGALYEQLTALLNRTGRLRNDWLVAEAEYLVRLANHRLLLDRDVNTALVALKAADQRIKEAGDPALLPARNALARDIQALQSVEKLDVAGVSAQLSALAGSVNKLPLATPEPDLDTGNARPKIQKNPAAGASKVSDSVQTPPADETTHWWDSFHDAWEVFRGLIVIREHDQPVQPLLPPEQRYFLTQNLQLQLEQARIALLRGETAVYRERLAQAQKWIKQFFNLDDSTTRAMLDNLQALAKQNVAPPLPDITGALAALTQYRSDRENARQGNAQ